MRHVTKGWAIVLALSAAAFAATPDPQIMAPIHEFVDSFNKGDASAAAATHSATDDLAIIDEVPPYQWRGPQAFQAWAADLDADSKRRGITDQHVTLGNALRVESNGEQAYVVVPTVYAFKEKGVAMSEKAQMTLALRKGAGGWLIHGWVWTGPKPKTATAAKK